MCLLALFFRVVEDAHLVVGANREEAYARAGDPPAVRNGSCRYVGGRDPISGGTWLGVNQHGVLVAVTNRPRTDGPAQPRSRGLLVHDLLGCSTARSAAGLAGEQLSQNRYSGCNLVCADSESLIVIHAGDWLRVRPLPPGLHVLTSHDVNDASDRRLGHALWWLNQRAYGVSSDCIDSLKELCGQAGGDDPPICLRGPEKGTVSSTIVALRGTLERSVYLHSQGPPDRTPYQDFSPLLRELT